MTTFIKPVVYDSVRHLIHNGDIGLCRPSSLEGQAIADFTQMKFSHATLFGWAASTLMIGETREHKDSRLIDARSEIFRYPGHYDVFRVVKRAYRGDDAWSFVCRAAGSRYCWRHITRVTARRVFGLIDLVPPIPNSDLPQYPRDCSALVHAATRLHGGPTIRQFDSDVVPGDLADPKFYRYLFTVFATEAQMKEFAARTAEETASRIETPFSKRPCAA